MNPKRYISLIAILFAPLAAHCFAADRPPADGLVLWLDASDANHMMVQVDRDNAVSEWKSKIGGPGASVLHGEERFPPRLIENGINGKPIVRFNGKSRLSTDHVIRDALGAATVFVVFQRSDNQVGTQNWQRLVSSQLDPKGRDNQLPNFCLISDSDGKQRATEPVIVHEEFGGVRIGQIATGGSVGGGNLLVGDIAEVLVYDRGFLSEGDLRVVLDYLHEKWNAKINETGWTRTGELGPTPAQTRQDLPLSDQANRYRWTLDPEFTDEFNGPQLDLKRWHLNPTSPGDWNGREPAMFLPSNLQQKDGMLHITFRKGDVPEMKGHKEYAGYTSALIRSNALTGYGYYEIRSKAMPSAGSSSFWFTDTGLSDQGTELDVFELGAKARGFERKYNMNAHVWKTPAETRHWAVGGVWNAPWNFSDDFHVYGFDWNKDELAWYVDGVVVRRAKNTNWFFPMRVMFDSEAMNSWFGKVEDADLPSTFSIDYLRVWRRADQR